VRVPVAVVDDDVSQATTLADQIARCRLAMPQMSPPQIPDNEKGGGDHENLFFDVHIFTDIPSVEQYLCDHDFDIVFMDINLGGDEDGVAAVARLFPRGSVVQVIYVTQHPEYHTKVYETDHACFLTKPVTAKDVEASLAKAVSRRLELAERPICIRTKSAAYMVAPNEITYVESARRVLHIHTLGETLDVYATLSQLRRLLPDYFLQCHKSYIVNLNFAKQYMDGRIVLISGENVPVSQRRRSYTRERLSAYIRCI
jgi:DNA-binding LytR/AlgR family response regulator